MKRVRCRRFEYKTSERKKSLVVGSLPEVNNSITGVVRSMIIFTTLLVLNHEGSRYKAEYGYLIEKMMRCPICS
jgi:hypothetical protein